jgi:glycerol kinase
MYARGALFGITRGVNRNHIVRAVLESIACQSGDILSVMEEDSGIRPASLKVDGGASANNFLMQFQSDLLGIKVIRPANVETTAQGAAFLAGLAAGIWQDKKEIESIWQAGREFVPRRDDTWRKEKYMQWKRAVNSCRSF